VASGTWSADGDKLVTATPEAGMATAEWYRIEGDLLRLVDDADGSVEVWRRIGQ